ncbi:MAG: DUF3387 domain-containing protein [Thermodesulfobacteriaceae bacterium]|nr:DUF3387 domain-containing protein [Thermodesulfobacteriaceae bacterium]
MGYKNYAAEVLTKILKDQLKVKFKTNPFRYSSLYERLNRLIKKYNSKILTVTKIIEELVNIAKDIKKQYEEGKSLGLTEVP